MKNHTAHNTCSTPLPVSQTQILRVTWGPKPWDSTSGTEPESNPKRPEFRTDCHIYAFLSLSRAKPRAEVTAPPAVLCRHAASGHWAADFSPAHPGDALTRLLQNMAREQLFIPRHTHTETLLGPLHSMLQEGEASSSSDRSQGALALLGLLAGKVCWGVNPGLFCLDIWFGIATQVIQKRHVDYKNRLSQSNTVARKCIILWTLDKILHGERWWSYKYLRSIYRFHSLPLPKKCLTQGHKN